MRVQAPFANEVLTPGSEPVFGGNEPFSLVFGRMGNDTLISYDFDSTNSSPINIDVLFGDIEIVPSLIVNSFFQTIAGNHTSGWRDRFVLGDWRQPYYVKNTIFNQLTLGFNDFAVVYDFNPSQDTIQFHGKPEDYQLVDIGIGKLVFWQPQGRLPDLVSLIVSSPLQPLNLNDDAFLFVGETPPPGPAFPQIKQLGSTGLDIGIALATDPDGNFYVGGGTNGSLFSNNQGAYDAWVVKYNQQGEQQWSKQFGTNTFDAIFNTITDRVGNVYMTGTTRGDLAAPLQAQGSDLWIGKYDSAGNLLWMQQTGTDLQFDAFDIAIDDNNNLYLSGNRVKNNPFPEQLGGVPVIDDPWVRKLDSDGNLLWSSEFGSPETFDESYGVAVSKKGKVYATGWSLGSLGGQNAGAYDVWLAQLDNQTGQPVWIDQLGSDNFEFSWDVEVDHQENIYTTGWTLGTLGDQSFGSYDVWLSKHLPDGTKVWTKQFGTSGDDASFLGGMDIDTNGNIYIAGYTDESLGAENAGSYDFWVAKYDGDGNQLWLQQWGTSNLDYATDVVVDNFGHLFVTGFTEGSLGALAQGAYDAWIAKIDTATGQLLNFTNPLSPDTTANNSGDRSTLPTSVFPANSAEDLLDLRSFANQTVQAEFILSREAQYDSLIGFYRVNEDGGIDFDDNGISDVLPGDNAYIKAALQQRLPFELTANNGRTISMSQTLPGGDLYAPFIVVNGSIDALLDDQAFNDPQIYFPFVAANADKTNHMLLLGKHTFAFEDMFRGGDLDFNDMVVQTKLAIA